jgi:hypothetical protein
MSKQDKGMRTDLDHFDPERRKKVDAMLIEGATFDDVVRTMNGEPGETICTLAVENYFRSNLELQKQRVRRMVEKMEALKKSIGDPESAEGKLAEAVLFTGLMGLTRSPMYADLEDVQTLRLKRDKLDLERTILEMREKEARDRRRLMQAQTSYVLAKCEKAKYELKKMEELLRSLKRGERLDGETLNKIREIYGIIKQPYIPPAIESPAAAPPQEQ